MEWRERGRECDGGREGEGKTETERHRETHIHRVSVLFHSSLGSSDGGSIFSTATGLGGSTCPYAGDHGSWPGSEVVHREQILGLSKWRQQLWLQRAEPHSRVRMLREETEMFWS